MKTSKIFFIIFCLLYPFSMDAQGIIFPNASMLPVWSTRYKLDLGNITYDFCHISKDTQICGKNYGLLNLYGSPQLVFPINLGFIRTEGKKVWLLKKNAQCSSKEYLLYDFGLRKGDTTYCAYFLPPLTGMPDTTKFWVNNIDSVFNEGRYIRRLRMAYVLNPPCGSVSNPCSVLTMDWLEGVGSTKNPFYPFDCFDCNQQVSLMCLKTNRGLQYLDPLYTSCPTTTSVKNIIENKSIRVFPNPISSILRLENSFQYIDCPIFITDLFGRVLKKEKLNFNQELNVSDLANGLYFLKIIKKEQIESAKFEIIR